MPASTDLSNLPRTIQQRRKELGLSPRDLAVRMGLSAPEAILHWEAGTRQVPLEKAAALAEGLGLATRDLILAILADRYPSVIEHLGLSPDGSSGNNK